jgi:hypothetical protein
VRNESQGYITQSENFREARVRRAAKRHGYRLHRSRWRRDSIDNLGGFQLIDIRANFVVAGHGLT